ncbi:MAG: response regulator [Caulobacterales bacterium]|nr:response regulator [Caulobacterales bacterium]
MDRLGGVVSIGADDFDPSDLTALVVDENHFERGISLDQLRAMGFRRAVGATNTMEAWDLLVKTNPDVVLVEWIQGVTDGLDFVRRIRQSEDSPNRAVNIFMLTSRGRQNDVEAARKAGVDGYMRKPISGLALRKRVKRVISHPQPFVLTAAYIGPCRRRKADAAYAGPWRRLDDKLPIEVAVDDSGELDVQADIARARVAALEARGRDLQIGDAVAAREVFRALQQLIEVAQQYDDAALDLGAREMARYLQAQGATDRLDPDVVRTHVAALHQLAHLPRTLGEERQRVALSLKRMVDKKLRQAGHAI